MPKSGLRNERERMWNLFNVDNHEISSDSWAYYIKSALKMVILNCLIIAVLACSFSLKGTISHRLKFLEYSLFYLITQLRVFVLPGECSKNNWTLVTSQNCRSYLWESLRCVAGLWEKVSHQRKPVSEGKSLYCCWKWHNENNIDE